MMGKSRRCKYMYMHAFQKQLKNKSYSESVVVFRLYYHSVKTPNNTTFMFASYTVNCIQNIKRVITRGGGRKRLPKFKFSAKFPIGLHVILQIQIKKFQNDCYLM